MAVTTATTTCIDPNGHVWMLDTFTGKGWTGRLFTPAERFEMDFQALRERAGIKLKLPWWKRMFRW